MADSRVSMDEAIRLAVSQAEPLPTCRLGLGEAVGFVLAEDIVAEEHHPPFRASVKDGYAVRSSDLASTAELHVAGTSRAGALETPVLGEKEAYYITTGGAVPHEADAVVEEEKTRKVNDRVVRILHTPTPGQDVRRVGQDMEKGTTLLHAGCLLGAPEVGILATAGVVDVCVHRRPVLAVLSTGDEVVDHVSCPAGALRPNAIRDAIRPMLVAAATERGLAARVDDLGICRDDADELRRAIQRALAGDVHLLVTSGGVSAGDKDLLGAQVLAEYGTVLYNRVHMKPGKPLTFTCCHRAAGKSPLLILSVPGNPVSALVTFTLVGVPVLQRLAGAANAVCTSRATGATLDARATLDPERPEWQRAVVTMEGDELRARTTGVQQSSRLLSCRYADALVALPQGPGRVEAGARVLAIPLRDWRRTAEPPPPLKPLRVAAVWASPHRTTTDSDNPPPGALVLLKNLARVFEGGGLPVHQMGVATSTATGAPSRAVSLATGGQADMVVVLHHPRTVSASLFLEGVGEAGGTRVKDAPMLSAVLRHAAFMASKEPTGTGVGWEQAAAVVDGSVLVLSLDAGTSAVRCLDACKAAVVAFHRRGGGGEGV